MFRRFVLLLLVGCGGTPELDVPERYAFESRFAPGTSSVAHAGQTARHVLIADLKRYVAGLDARASAASWTSAADVYAELDYFFGADAASRAADPIGVRTEPPPRQSTYGELSGSATLIEKLAGNDASTDHRDFSTDFAGWSDPDVATACAAVGVAECGLGSPTRLVRAFFATLAVNAMMSRDGSDRPSPIDGTPLPVHVTASGLDLTQLVEKLLLGAIAFHQAADDYLDDDPEDAGKGLLSDHTMDAGGYTALEHAWDEGFGYFGAAADYGEYGAAALTAGPVFRDTDGDGAIDLFTEHNFGASINAAKRDEASAAGARTDFFGQAWLAFRTGRAILARADGPLDQAQLDALRAQRDLAIGAWEAAYAATVVHYLNEVLQAMRTFGAGYDQAAFLEHAKAWSEMKGFALAFQLDPRSPVSRDDFVRLHALLRDAPVLPGSTDPTPEAYRDDLLEARAILAAAFGFDAANVGDENGENGW